jgi:hypothetical protein
VVDVSLDLLGKLLSMIYCCICVRVKRLGVVASTISIAMPDLEDSIDPPSSGGSSDGGCVYNPNAPARFDMVFILLMVLSAYYLIRRKRQFIR